MPRQLTNRDREILEFINRYRIGTTELIHQYLFSAQPKSENVERILSRMERRRLLRKIPMTVGRSYFVLTRQSHKLLGLEPRVLRPLTEQTLPSVLAVATYCVRQQVQRLTSTEFQKIYPELWRPGMRSANYVLRKIDQKLCLELLVVDRGAAAHRVNSKVHRLIKQRESLPAFSTLVEAGRFRITVLMGTTAQQQKIQHRLSQRDWSPVEVFTDVIPELADILLLRK